MELYEEVVLDLAGNAIEGAQVRVLKLDGSDAIVFNTAGAQVSNPVMTGALGEFSFQAPNGKYNLRILVGGVVYRTVGPVLLFDPVDDATLVRQAQIDILYFGAINACKYMTDAEKANGKANLHSINVTAKIQQVIDEAEPFAKAVFLPSGSWDVRDGLKFANSAKFIGENQRSAGLFGSAAAPTIGSKTGYDLNFCTFMDFAVVGGAHCFGINVSSETAFNKFIRVDTSAAAGYDCYHFNKLMQTSLWDGCFTNGGNRGIACVGFTANSNVIRNCKMGNHAQAHIYLRGATLNTVFNVTHEGGGVPGQAVYDIDNSIGFNVSECAYENVHPLILKETNSTNTTTFHKNDFIYGIGSVPLQFSSDGEVEFGTNTWYLPSDGPAKMRIVGDNQGKLGKSSSRVTTVRTLADNQFSSGTRPYPISGQQDLIKFSCGVPDNSLTRLATLRGTLTVHYESINTGGSTNVIFSRTYRVKVASRAGLALIGSAVLIDSDDTLSGGSALAVGVKSGATPFELIVEANFTSVSPTAGQSIFSWAFESTCAASDIVMYIAPSLPG